MLKDFICRRSKDQLETFRIDTLLLQAIDHILPVKGIGHIFWKYDDVCGNDNGC